MLGNRIKRARKALGLSLRDLADEISLSHAAIKKYEDNKVAPSSDILIKLAKVLHVKVEYFFRTKTPILDNIQYRKHADVLEKHLEEINIKILDQAERRMELESLFPTAPIKFFSIETLSLKEIQSLEDIEELADEMRKRWCLGLDPIPDIIDVFEEQGIKVFEIDTHRFPKFEGLFAHISNIPIIVIGNERPGDRQRFTLVHELGHLILDDFSNNLEEEACCNRFAGAFLLPRKSLKRILGEHRNYIEPRELSLIKQEFGISMSSILHRVEEIGIISKALYRKLRSEFNERDWLRQEPGAPYPQEKTHIFEQMIFHALAEDYIGESKAAELMNISLESFRARRALEQNGVTYYQ